MNLYSHIWKSFFRNERWRRNLLTRILFVLLIIYLIAVFLMVGLHLEEILKQVGGDPVYQFNTILIGTWYLIS